MLVHLAGAASFSPPTLALCLSLSVSPSRSLSPLSLNQCALCSVCACVFFLPSLSFLVSQWRQLREAAACLSASQLPQVKTAVSSDVANPEGGLGSLCCCGCKFSSRRGAHISNHLEERILEGTTSRGPQQTDQQITR